MKQTLSKVIVVITLIVCAFPPIFAQDIIITNQAKKIDANILEISASSIKYKEFDNLNGPTFVLNVDEINSIIYSNGRVVLYNQRTNASTEDDGITSVDKKESLSENVDNSLQGGNIWNLNGRRLKGSLPRPSQNFAQEGLVVVNIIVDANGKVVSAKVGAGTTITDETTRQLALRAAKKAEFDKVDRPNQQFGTITYKFKFN